MKSWLLVALTASRVLACATVEGDRIRGAEFATADARFAVLDPELDLGPAPSAGIRRVFRASELARIAASHGIAEAPQELCFERVANKLTAEKLLPLLQAALGQDDIEILDFSKLAVPQGSIEFTRTGLATSGFWRGRILYGKNRAAPVWVKIRVGDSIAGRVERGQSVRVEVRSGGVLLAFDASAETSGRTGDPVIVKNPQNGKRFQARVEGDGKVSIKK